MTGKPMRQQFADTMQEIGRQDPRLVVLVGDISHFILQPFAQECPGRYYNVGICESAIVSMAAGLSKTGFYPVAHTIAPFILERPFEHIKLDFCYQKLGGNIVTVGSAFDYATLGCTHHCYNDFAILKVLPNIQITYPSSPVEFDTLFRQTYQNEYLTVFRLPGEQHEFELADTDIRLGKGIKITDGKDMTIVATGPQLKSALGAREELINRGWQPEILYIHTIRPLDADIIRTSVEKTHRVLVIEEHMTTGGLGDDVLRTVRDIPDVSYSSLSIPDRFITSYGSYQYQCDQLGLNSEGVLATVAEEFGTPKGK